MGEKADDKARQTATVRDQLRVPDPQNLNECCRELAAELAAYHSTLQAQNRELELAQQQLQESRNRYFQLFEAAPIGFLLIDRYRLIHDANAAALEMLSLPREMLSRRPFSRYLHPEDVHIFMAHRKNVATRFDRATCEVRLKRPDGSWRHILLSSLEIAEPTFALGAILVALTDISDLKNTEAELRHVQAELARQNQLAMVELDLTSRRLAQESSIRRKVQSTLEETEQRYGLLVENANEAIVVAQDGRLRFANRRLAELLGLSPDELSGEEFLQYIHPDDRNLVYHRYRSILDRVGELEPTDLRIMPRGRGERWMRTNSILIQWQGRPAVLSLLTDVTRRKEAELQLDRERELLQSILNNIPVMIAGYDRDGRIVFVNPELEKTIGWTAEDFDAIGAFELCYPDPTYRQQVLQFMMECPHEWQDIETRTKWGTTVATSWTNVRLDDGRHLGIGIDIRNRKKAERELRTAYTQLETERLVLERKNTALREVLAQFEASRSKLEQNVAFNIDRTILPLLQKIRKRAGRNRIQLHNLDLVDRELKELTSPLVPILKLRFGNLTKREQEVCRMIARGMSTAEITEKLGLSAATIQKYRELIRKKLDLTGSRMNLNAFLTNLADDEKS